MWNAIDLHMHTSTGITRDGGKDLVNFTYSKLIEVIDKYELKLIAITNHNFIDFENFILSKYLADRKNCNVLLGVEIDTVIVDNNDGKMHTIAISENNFTSNFSMSLLINDKSKKKKAKGEVVYNPDELIEFIRNHNLVLIPHGTKDKGIFEDPSQKNILTALKIVREGFVRVFDNSSDWKLERVKQFLIEENYGENIDDFGGVLFSDIRDWEEYESKFRNFYMNAEPTFKGLVHSLSNPTERFSVKEHIKYNNNYISKISIRKKDGVIISDNDKLVIENTDLFLDRGYNCIIGKSGTGKSLMLEVLEKKLFNPEVNNYKVLENYEIFIYDENDKPLEVNNSNIGIGENIYKKIIAANRSSDNTDMYEIINLLNKDFEKKKKFSAYNNIFQSKVQDYIKLVKKIEGLESHTSNLIFKFISDEITLRNLVDVNTFDIDIPNDIALTYSEENKIEFGKYSESIKELKKYADLLIDVDKEELNLKIDELSKLFKDKKEKLEKTYYAENYNSEKKKTIKAVLEEVNGVSSENAKKKSGIITNMGDSITNVVENIIKYKMNQFLETAFKVSYDYNDVYREEYINSKKTIKVLENIEITDIKEVNEKNNTVFNTYGKRQLLSDKIYDISKHDELKNLLNKYINAKVIDENFIISDNFRLSVDVFFNDINIKKLNPGDIAKTYIEVYFEDNIINSNSSIIIFDQLENNVDKDFISTVIKNQISKTKGNVQFIVVTHDPIIAVNADPTNYILSQKDDHTISYRNFRAESYDRDELTTIANTVDGSKNVIKNRYEIYKGDNNYEY